MLKTNFAMLESQLITNIPDFPGSSCFSKSYTGKMFNLPYFNKRPGFFEKNLLKVEDAPVFC